MKINTREFQETLKKLERAIPKKPEISILEGVKLKVNNNNLTLSVTDLKNYVIANIEAFDVETDFETVILNPKELTKSFKFMKEGITELKLLSDVISINNGSKEINLKTRLAEDFPEVPDVTDIKHEYKYNTKDLHNRIKKVDYAVAKDTSRPALTGICFNENDIVALDGYRLALSKDNKLYIEEPLLIPYISIDFIIKTINKKTEDKLKISNTKEYAIFEYDNIKVISKLIEEEYFKYEQIFPKDYKVEAKVYLNEFKNNTEFLNIYAKDVSNNMVGLKIHKEGKIVNSVVNENGEFKTETLTDKGYEFEIYYNNKFMLDVLKALEDDFKLQFIGDVSPMVLDVSHNEKHLLLPVRKSKTERYIKI